MDYLSHDRNVYKNEYVQLPCVMLNLQAVMHIQTKIYRKLISVSKR